MKSASYCSFLHAVISCRSNVDGEIYKSAYIKLLEVVEWLNIPLFKPRLQHLSTFGLQHRWQHINGLTWAFRARKTASPNALVTSAPTPAQEQRPRPVLTIGESVHLETNREQYIYICASKSQGGICHLVIHHSAGPRAVARFIYLLPHMVADVRSLDHVVHVSQPRKTTYVENDAS